MRVGRETTLTLVNEMKGLAMADAETATNAITMQIARDVAPIWDVNGRIAAVSRVKDIPKGAWPVFLREDIGTPGAAAFHADKNGAPYGMVAAIEGWQLSLSHTVLEMLVNPFGNRVVSAGSVAKGRSRKVSYLVQICDPCEGTEFAYDVSGITVSDFCTPRYYDDRAEKGVRYSFRGNITVPLQVLKGGYLSWHDPADGHWYQKIWFGNRPEIRDLGVFESPREDRQTRSSGASRLRLRQRIALTPLQALTRVEESTSVRARHWELEIDQLLKRFRATS